MTISNEDKASILEFADKIGIKYHIGWKNFPRNNQQPEAIVLDVEDIDSIPKILLKINKINEEMKPEDRITLRVAAGGNEHFFETKKEYSQSFSFTPCIKADVIVRLVGSEFQTIKVLDKKNKIVQVGAGVQIGNLNQTLYDEHKLVLPTASVIPYVTFVGLTANSGHGTGQDQPSVSGLIRALTICRPDGKVVRIDSSHKDFETIRAGHLGLFGIVLNVEIECIEAKKIKRVIETKTLSDFKKEIQAGIFYKYPYVSAMYIPTYQQEKISKNVITITWEPIPLSEINSSIPATERHLKQEFLVNLSNTFKIGTLLSRHTFLIPYYMKYFVSKFAVNEINTTTIGPWPDMVHYQTAYPWNLDDSGYLFNVSDNGSEIINAIDHITETLDKYERNKKYPIINTFYLRLIQGTNGGLSTSSFEEKKHVCAFDIVSDPRVPGYEQFKKDIQPYFLRQLKGKPHWGKTVPTKIDYHQVYGKGFENFKDSLLSWYKSSNVRLEESPFLNQFFCEVLQLPYSPTAIRMSDKKSEHKHSHEPLNPTIPFAKIAQDIINYIEQIDNDVEKNSCAKDFIEQLNIIAHDQINIDSLKSFSPKNSAESKDLDIQELIAEANQLSEEKNNFRMLAISQLKLQIGKITENTETDQQYSSLVKLITQFTIFDNNAKKIFNIKSQYKGGNSYRLSSLKQIENSINQAYSMYASGLEASQCDKNLIKMLKNIKTTVKTDYQQHDALRFFGCFRPKSQLIHQIDNTLSTIQKVPR